MSKPLIVITSGTSRNAGEAAKLLLAHGKCTVRLAARDPTKLAAFVALGAEAVRLDSTLESATQAFTGANSIYIILPALVGQAREIIEIFISNFIRAAKETGVKHIVYLSAVDAEPHIKSYNKHYENEQRLFKSGIPCTSLRPTYFHENFIAYYADEVKRTGQFSSSAGDGVYTTVAVCDVAAAAAAVLINPSKHADKIYILETETVTEELVAEKISKVIGKKVAYVSLTPEEEKVRIRKNCSGDRNAEVMADQLVQLNQNKRDSLFSVVRPDLELVLGRKGVSVDEFLAEHANAFKDH